MQKRISHKKSRRGCQSCKKKHVKCDEQGPPCANCVVRKIECVYEPSSNAGVKKKRAVPLARRPKRASPQTAPTSDSQDYSQGSSRGSSPGSTTLSESSTTLVINPVTSLNAPSPAAFSSVSESNRLLELELMHRWSTRTWTGLHSFPEDKDYLQILVPRSALKSSYLMNGILAMAAADLARYSNGSDSAIYFRAALEYGNKASVDFRSELSHINQENLHLLYHFAMMAAIFNFAVPAKQMGIMDRIFTVFDMVIGAAHVAWTNFHWLLNSPYPIQTVLECLPIIIMSNLDLETDLALDRLRVVSRQIRLPVTPAINDKTASTGQEVRGRFASDVNLYQLAISQLRSCFSEEAGKHINGYCLTFITSVGREFSQAIKNYEPMALFILMHFGVLLDQMGTEPTQWWIASAGKDLVREVSETLLGTPISLIPEGRDGIAWTRQQVGLPPLEALAETIDDYFVMPSWALEVEKGTDFDPDQYLKRMYLEGVNAEEAVKIIKGE